MIPHDLNLNVCTHYFNGGCVPLEVKTKDGNITKLHQFESLETTKENYITHTRHLLQGNERFKKLVLDKLRDYKTFVA